MKKWKSNLKLIQFLISIIYVINNKLLIICENGNVLINIFIYNTSYSLKYNCLKSLISLIFLVKNVGSWEN